MQTVTQFLRSQVRKPEDFPPGTKFMCIRCADCCQWNYYFLNTPQELIDQLYMLGVKYPHGYWVLVPPQLQLYMPIWSKKAEAKMFHFTGDLPEVHVDFLTRTQRRHGYWVLTQEDQIAVYCPSICKQLTETNECAIYADRPEICKNYQCTRYPILPSKSA